MISQVTSAAVVCTSWCTCVCVSVVCTCFNHVCIRMCTCMCVKVCDCMMCHVTSTCRCLDQCSILYIKSTLTCSHKHFHVGVCMYAPVYTVVACTTDVVGHSQTSLHTDTMID